MSSEGGTSGLGRLQWEVSRVRWLTGLGYCGGRHGAGMCRAKDVVAAIGIKRIGGGGCCGS